MTDDSVGRAASGLGVASPESAGATSAVGVGTADTIPAAPPSSGLNIEAPGSVGKNHDVTPNTSGGVASKIRKSVSKNSLGSGLAAPEPRRIAEDITLDAALEGPTRVPRALLDRFASFELLGRGGMGVVYRARDKALNRDVAVKLLIGADTELQSRLLREARSQARLSHDNVCEVYEVGIADGQGFFVMQYIEGHRLDALRARMTVEEMVAAVRTAADALHEAHRIGIVHRDVKPSNIMVERREDGSYKPYLMDFGIARDIDEREQTHSGAISGTPAFMAPEQARGAVRSLDRRTDVYGLGATLYHVLAGAPPFTARTLLELLKQITEVEAPPLRSVRPDVPEDLEAITMKCLEKAPAQRYESARALAEDLQRFLEGEQVSARPRSLYDVLLKKAKRNKGRVIAAAALLAAAIVMLSLWVRSRRIAAEQAARSAEQAALAEQLGESVKEMELFLRSAYGMPLHDIDRERAVVRQRLEGIKAKMAAVGPVGEGPGSYALGRGYLALQEIEPAMTHLQRAIDAGYSPPGLEYSMGLALGELYRRALEEARRIMDPDRRKARVAAIEAEYKEPALRYLRETLGGTLESPAYVEGLIAFYERRYDAALAKAEEAFQAAPWLYEAKLLEGYVHFEEGSQFRRDAAFDYEKMALSFNRASKAYDEVADIARSDARVYEAECDLWTQMILAAEEKTESLKPSFERAKLACDNATTASPRTGALRVKSAFVYQAYGFQLINAQPAESDAEPIVEEAIRRSRDAASQSPTDAMAHYVLGASWRTQVQRLLNNGLDARAANDSAIASYNEAVQLDPSLVWAYTELCSSYAERAAEHLAWGKDPAASVDTAVAQCTWALELEPSFIYALLNKAYAHYQTAQWLASSGRSPEPAINRLLDACAAAQERSPNSPSPMVFAVWAHLLMATFAIENGQDPSASLELASKRAAELEALSPSSPPSLASQGMLESTRALALLRRGEDPTGPQQKAAKTFQRLLEESPSDLDYRLSRARAEILAVRWALKKKKATEASFAAALAPLAPLLTKDRADPRLYQTVAEIHELWADFRVAGGKAADAEVTKGIEMADKALSINPHLAEALASKGALYLARARAAKDAGSRREAAREADQAFDAAVREDPLLARERGPALEDARRLMADPPAKGGR